MAPDDAARVIAPVIAVVGATAAGKSRLALALATELGGDVVNADSMQLYRGMDIGTAKLPAAERAGIPHHLLDIWDVTETASVADYQQRARAAFAEIAARGGRSVLVGGSGLYVRAALDDLEFPGTDPGVRGRLEAELEAYGSTALHARLARVDPVAADRILVGNGRRIVRALEVVEITGRPYVASLPEPAYAVPAVQVGIEVPRPVLDERIAARVEAMWQSGFVAEVRDLAEHAGLTRGRTASRALGYAQVLRHLAGEWSEQRASEEAVRATRRFARRQETWFRRDPRVHWLGYDDPALVSRAVEIAQDLNMATARGGADA
jgi:tRNA dimethylallyltransferase